MARGGAILRYRRFTTQSRLSQDRASALCCRSMISSTLCLSRRGSSTISLQEKVEEARLTIHEIKLKAHPPNLASYGPGGKYLSLIYVHLTIVKTPRKGWDCDDLWDTEPETGTDCSQVFKDGDIPLMQLLIIDGSNIRNFVPGGVVVLDSVKGIKRVLEQSSSSGREAKKTMLAKEQIVRDGKTC